MTGKTPIHQWTNGGNKVLLVKCVDKNGRGYGGFQWPKSGPVDPGKCSLEPTRESGGLFGWAWGLNLGGGKEPGYSGCWIVFAADPAIVVEIDGEKHKAAGACEVVYYGDWAGALTYTMAGRLAWLGHVTENAESQSSRLRGAASATGWSGAASATGESGAASATGWRGAAFATGERGAASATGERGAASATGESGAASATGTRGAAFATGESGAASATGWRGAASATGLSGAASATGLSGAASATGENSSIEIGPEAAGVCTAREFTWIYHAGAVLLARWPEGHKTFVGDLGYAEGARVLIRNGEIVEVR